MNKCLYAGSFDPFHYGHQHLVERASRIFDQVVVLQAYNPSKKYTLPSEISVELIRRSIKHLPNVKVVQLPRNYLAVDFAKEQGIHTIVKGIRNIQDTEYERMLHEISVSQQQGVDTVVMFSDPKDHKISSTAVKELMKFNGDVREYIPLWTKQRLEIAQGQFIYGITGEMGSGKSWVTNQLVSATRYSPATVVANVDLDKIAREAIYPLQDLTEEVKEVQGFLEDTLKITLRDYSKTLNTGPYKMRVISAKFFAATTETRAKIAAVCNPLIVKAVRHYITAVGPGLFYLNGALLVDYDLTYLCNNNVTVVHTPAPLIKTRLRERYPTLSCSQISQRIKAQLSSADKLKEMKRIIARDGYGTVSSLDNGDNNTFDADKYGRSTLRSAFII